MFRAAFPLLLLSLNLAPRSHESHAECSNHHLEAQHPRALMCTGFECRGTGHGGPQNLTVSVAGGRHQNLTVSAAGGRHRWSWGKAGESWGGCSGTQKFLKLRVRAPSLLLRVEGEESEYWTPCTYTCTYLLINWIIEPESQAFKYYLGLCLKHFFKAFNPRFKWNLSLDVNK